MASALAVAAHLEIPGNLQRERVLVAMARLGLDERLVKISEAQGKLITGVILGAFADVGLSHEMQQAVRPAMARRLRLLAADERQREQGPH
ncbi:MAG: hypothetical protein ACRDOU_30340 [Streptosporangiaceae bacterium]